MVVELLDRVEVEWFGQAGPDCQPEEHEFAVSGIGLIAAASVTQKGADNGEPFIAVSPYAHWNPAPAPPERRAASHPTCRHSSSGMFRSQSVYCQPENSTTGTLQEHSAACDQSIRWIP